MEGKPPSNNPKSSGIFMKWIFQNDLIGRLQRDSEIPFGAFFEARS
jgi:hypothetical protein